VGKITETHVAVAIVTMVMVNVGRETNREVNLALMKLKLRKGKTCARQAYYSICELDLSIQRRAHDRGRCLIASVGRVYYRPRSGEGWYCTPWAKSDIYDCLVHTSDILNHTQCWGVFKYYLYLNIKLAKKYLS